MYRVRGVIRRRITLSRRPCAKQIHTFTIDYSAPGVNRHTWFDAKVSGRVGVYLHSNISLALYSSCIYQRTKAINKN